MVGLIDDRLNRARELAQAARDEFARAQEAKGREAAIGLQNSCGKGWLAALEATQAYFLMHGVPETELPKTDRGWRYFVANRMERDMSREFIYMRQTFHVDGYYGGIVDFDHMPLYLDELEEFIETFAESPF
jgi:hypothetical protein